MNVTDLLRSRSVSARGALAALMLLPLVTACDFTGSVASHSGKKHSFASQEAVPNGTAPGEAPSNDARPNQRLSKEANPNDPVPAWVSDQADVIPAANEERITQSLAALEQRTGHQLVVVTVPSLEGKSVEEYTFALANKWGVGRKGYGDGAVILVAPNERKMRIELGWGLDCFISNTQPKPSSTARWSRASRPMIWSAV